MNINRVTLLGYLAHDVSKIKNTKDISGSSFTVVTNYQKTAEFHRCVAWGKLSDIASTYCKKGDRVYLEGRLSTSSWVDADKKKRSSTQIVASHLIMLGRSNGAAPDGRDGLAEGDSA